MISYFDKAAIFVFQRIDPEIMQIDRFRGPGIGIVDKIYPEDLAAGAGRRQEGEDAPFRHVVFIQHEPDIFPASLKLQLLLHSLQFLLQFHGRFVQDRAVGIDVQIGEEGVADDVFRVLRLNDGPEDFSVSLSSSVHSSSGRFPILKLSLV